MKSYKQGKCGTGQCHQKIWWDRKKKGDNVMKKLTDDQIRNLAKQAGWWSTYEAWWEQEIPRLRKFLELALKEMKGGD